MKRARAKKMVNKHEMGMKNYVVGADAVAFFRDMFSCRLENLFFFFFGAA
jgi:hypothetical protein